MTDGFPISLVSPKDTESLVLTTQIPFLVHSSVSRVFISNEEGDSSPFWPNEKDWSWGKAKEGGGGRGSSGAYTYHLLIPFIICEQPLDVQGVFFWKPQLMMTGQSDLLLCHSPDLSVSPWRSNIVGHWKRETFCEYCRNCGAVRGKQILHQIVIECPCGPGPSPGVVRTLDRKC